MAIGVPLTSKEFVGGVTYDEMMATEAPSEVSRAEATLDDHRSNRRSCVWREPGDHAFPTGPEKKRPSWPRIVTCFLRRM